MPTNFSYKILNSTYSQPPKETFQSLTLPAVKANYPFWCLSLLLPAAVSSVFLVLPAVVRTVRFLHLYNWLLQIWRRLSHHLETSLIFHPLIPLIAELSPVAPHFPWSAVPAAGHHIQERLSYYHMKKDHIMHLADYISLHTFHNNFCLFFWQHTVAMLSWWLAIIRRLFFCTTAVPALCPVPFCNCSADCCFGRAKICICQIHCWTYRIAVTWIY